jgi:hypothetical protein
MHSNIDNCFLPINLSQVFRTICEYVNMYVSYDIKSMISARKNKTDINCMWKKRTKNNVQNIQIKLKIE